MRKTAYLYQISILINLSQRHYHFAITHSHTYHLANRYMEYEHTPTHSICQESNFDEALSTVNMATKLTPWQ